MSSALVGKEIVITRPKKQSEEMLRLIKERGAKGYLFPVIETAWTNNIEPLNRALKQIECYDCFLFTSVNGVHYFFSRIEELYDLKAVSLDISRKKVAAIGPKTAGALESYGIRVSPLPTSFKQESLVEQLKIEFKKDIENKLHIEAQGLEDIHILFPQAKSARKHLGEQLRHLGMRVDEVEVYQTIKVKQSNRVKEEFLKKLEKKEIDVITFTSPSTIKSFYENLKHSSWQEYLDSVAIACIGPITAQAARELGLKVTIEADTYTVEGLLEEIEQYFIQKRVQNNELF